MKIAFTYLHQSSIHHNKVIKTLLFLQLLTFHFLGTALNALVRMRTETAVTPPRAITQVAGELTVH